MTLPPLPWGSDLEAWLEVRSAAEIEADIRAYAEAAVLAERAEIASWLERTGHHILANAIKQKLP